MAVLTEAEKAVKMKNALKAIKLTLEPYLDKKHIQIPPKAYRDISDCVEACDNSLA